MADTPGTRPKWAFDPTTYFIDESDPCFDATRHEAELLTRNNHLPLVLAAQTNDLPTVVQLLAEGKVDVNAAGTLGETALHMAAALGHTDVLDALLAAGADANARGLGGRGSSPLIHAARFCPSDVAQEVLQKLLEAGADATYGVTIDFHPLSALHWAVHAGNVAAIPLLARVCPHERAIREATSILRAEMVMRRRGNQGWTRHAVESIRLLLDSGVKPDRNDLREALFAGSWLAFEILHERLALTQDEFDAFADEVLADLVYENTMSPDVTLFTVAQRFMEVYGLDVNYRGIPGSIVASGDAALLDFAVSRGLVLSSLSDEDVQSLVDEARKLGTWRATPKDWPARITALRK